MGTKFTDLETLTHCPACGKEGPFAVGGDHLARCNDCRVYFVNPRPTQAEIISHYNSAVTFDNWARERTEVRDKLWYGRAKLLGPAEGRTLLDIGCGDGYFLTVAAACGFKVSGTEASVAGAQRAQAKGHQVAIGQLGDIDFGTQKFDVITLFHVLEHVPNPGEVLAQARSLMNPQGTILVAVPNEARYFVKRGLGLSRKQVGTEFGVEIHLTFFQPSTLRAALRRAGFKVVDFGVDDDAPRPRFRQRAIRRANKIINALTGWNCSHAMYAIATAA